MNGINNNISNSNYGSFGNGGSNSPKDEKSVFDNIVDSVKEFFDGESGDSEYSSYTVKSNRNANLERAFFNSRSNMESTYTLAPQKNEVTMGEKWAKENENAEIKQKEREIANLKQKVDTLQSRNKMLTMQNEQISEQVKSQQPTKETVTTEQPVLVQNNVNEDPNAPQEEQTKTYGSVPTHTSIPREVLEQQENEINQMASNSKPEAPKKSEETDDSNNVEAKA